MEYQRNNYDGNDRGLLCRRIFYGNGENGRHIGLQSSGFVFGRQRQESQFYHSRLLNVRNYANNEAVRYFFIGIDENGNLRSVREYFFETPFKVYEIDPFLVDENFIVVINGHLDKIVDFNVLCVRLGQIHLNALRHHRGRNHENDEQREHHVHQVRNIQVGDESSSSVRHGDAPVPFAIAFDYLPL
jgi:hypothetical protein